MTPPRGTAATAAPLAPRRVLPGTSRCASIARGSPIVIITSAVIITIQSSFVVSLDMVVELRTAAGSDLLHDVLAVRGVTSASLLCHDGEVTF